MERPLPVTRSEPRIDRLALQGEDAEHALVDPAERLPADEPLQPLDPQGELAEGERPLPPQPRSRSRVRLAVAR